MRRVPERRQIRLRHLELRRELLEELPDTVKEQQQQRSLHKVTKVTQNRQLPVLFNHESPFNEYPEFSVSILELEHTVVCTIIRTERLDY